MTKVKARTVLWYLVFVGFAVNYMIRINLNITIVDMIAKRGSYSKFKISSECLRENDHLNPLELKATEGMEIVDTTTIRSAGNSNNYYLRGKSVENFNGSYPLDIQNGFAVPVDQTFNHEQEKRILDAIEVASKVASRPMRGYSIEKEILNQFEVNYDKDGFNWDEYQQGLALGSFFWLHWVTQIPGGILARKYGTKLIFGLANVIGCWMCFLIPIFSYWDFKYLLILRVIQGLICGLAWPAMHNMTAQWIPPNERSKFVTAYLGSSVGIAIFYPLFGYVISWTSWEWVFHVCGIIGTIWYIGWVMFVFDTPAKHPRISETERKYIEKSLGASISEQNKKTATPWKHILTSKSVWMNVIAQWGGIWGLFTLMTQAPTYFKIIHGWDIKMTGILSGLPHMMRMIFAYVFSTFGDYLLKSEKMSRTNVRKLATTICCIVKGLFVLALAYSGCNSTAAILFLTTATAVHGAVSTGPLASIVDIAPNYAGIVLGISGMIGVLPGFISPAIVGILTLGNQTVTSWKYVFLISSGMLIVSGVLYVIFCESTLQDWNNPSKRGDNEEDKEMQLLSEEDKEKSKNLQNDSEKIFQKEEKQNYDNENFLRPNEKTKG